MCQSIEPENISINSDSSLIELNYTIELGLSKGKRAMLKADLEW